MKNPVKNKKKDVEMLADSIGIPGTSVSLPVLTLIGNKEMYIENFKSIMEYECDSVKVITRRGIVHVKGSDLDIGYLDMDEISIKGRIKEITFE